MKHIIKVPVRFGDTDMLGHVNNSRYFTYMEEARVHFFRDVVGNPESGVDNIPLILASAQVNFRAQTYYPSVLRVESWVSRWGNSSFDVSCAMFNENTGEKNFEGVSVLVYFDYERQKPVRIPEVYRTHFASYTGESG